MCCIKYWDCNKNQWVESLPECVPLNQSFAIVCDKIQRTKLNSMINSSGLVKGEVFLDIQRSTPLDCRDCLLLRKSVYHNWGILKKKQAGLKNTCRLMLSLLSFLLTPFRFIDNRIAYYLRDVKG
jgi:hypothetical protein